MNMILAGDGHSNIHMRDSLANPIDGEYDVVLANMPYSQKTKFGSLYDLPTNNGDSICVQHCMKAISGLSENGRMALVVPEGFLFRKDLAKVREYLLERTQLQSIISLPQGVFLPYTSVKTNIIYATKVNQKIPSKNKRKDFWYFDVKNDGYSLDNHRRKLDATSDLSKYEEYRRLDDDEADEMMKVGFEIIPFSKVRENFFVLVGSRYREHKISSLDYELVSLYDLEKDRSIIIEKGKSITKVTATTGSYPVIAGGQTSPYSHNVYNQEADVITVSASGAYSGFVWHHDYPIWASDCSVIRGINDDTVSTKYLYYILKGKQNNIYTMQHGTGQPHVYPDDLRTIIIPLPSIDEQLKIVNELDGYQKIIDGARAVVKNYKPSFKIHETWETKELSEVCSFQYGYTNTALNDGDTRFIRITDINKDGTLSNNNIKYTNLNDDNKKYLLEKDDLLVARIGATYGKTLLYSSEEDAVFASYLIRLRLDKSILPKYYFYFSQHNSYWEQAKDLVTGGAQPQFNSNTIKLIKLPIPDLEEQKRIVDKIEAEQALIEPSKQLIEVFTKKIKDRISDIFID